MLPDFSSAAKPKQNPRGGAMRILLITPPMVQLNTPYPATAVLAGFLQECGFRVAQADLSLGLALRLFSAEGLRQVEAAIRVRRARTPATRHFLAHAKVYIRTVESVVAFLQGRDDTLAWRIAGGGFLPEGPRFQRAEVGDQRSEGKGWTALIPNDAAQRPMTNDFVGEANEHDFSKHFASLYLDDLADAIREGVDPRFGFARYAEHLAVAAPRFDPLQRALEGRPTLLDRMLDEMTDAAQAEHQPALVGLTVPFPGTLYGALRIARRIRWLRPRTRIALGGGYVNTELRELDDPRIFDYADYLCFDDGEEPLLRIAQTLAGARAPLVRTLMRRRGRVVKCGTRNAECGMRSGEAVPATPNSAFRIPHFSGLPLDRYISLAESSNPMHRLWSDGRWLKIQLAHGCYWRECRFCDTALDYIGRYVPPRAEAVVDRMAELHRRTGLSGFHFTDEALAPALLRQVSERLTARGMCCTWWGNIRFERAFTRDLAAAMARAGCVAVTGGLECAHDRLLTLMNKGITLRGAARACKAFADAGIHVHAYLMYGFPTQTVQETIDGLEYVRQLFAAGVVQSAYWHRFALTCHSPIAATPEAFGIRIRRPRTIPGRTFARNELMYEILPGRGASGQDFILLGEGLRRATYNYMLGVGLDEPMAAWFDFEVPEPALPPNFVARA
jgi:radical SAM superfamily enzyme YgiQ (UPF0313 family)